MVTGASRGLGLAVARALAAEGARLVVTATAVDHLDGAVGGIRAAGGEVTPLAMDLGDAASVTAAAAAAAAALGRVDLLVNNAGVFRSRERLVDTPPEELEHVLAIDAVGPLRLTRALLPSIPGGGAIVMVTSSAGPRDAWGAYGIAKLALEGMTRMLRRELAERGIRVVAVDPGGMRTDMRAEVYPDEDPATVGLPSTRTPAFVEIAAGADPGWRVEAYRWP